MTINPVATVNTAENIPAARSQNACASPAPSQYMGMDSFVSTAKDAVDKYFSDQYQGSIPEDFYDSRPWSSLTDDEKAYLKGKYNVNSMTIDETLSMLEELHDMKLISSATRSIIGRDLQIQRDILSPLANYNPGYTPLSATDKNDIMKNYILRFFNGYSKEEELEIERDQSFREYHQRLAYATAEVQKVLSNLEGGMPV